MDGGVVDADDRPVDRHGPRDENGVTVDPDHPLRQAGLAGAGRAVEEDGALVHERRSQLIEHVVLDDEVAEGRSDRFPVHHRGGSLGHDGPGVVGQRDRHRRRIGRGVHAVEGDPIAELGERRSIVATLETLVLDQVAVPQVVGDVPSDRHADPEGPRHAIDRRDTLQDQPAHEQVLDHRAGNVQLGEVGGRAPVRSR